MSRFLDNKAAFFDQLPPGLGAGLMPQADRLLCRVSRRADILTTPFGTEPPHFVQQRQRTTRVDFAHKMQPSGRQRQALVWDQASQASIQQPHARATSHLSWALARERGWIVMIHIPVPE